MLDLAWWATLGVATSDVRVVSGHASPRKRLAVDGHAKWCSRFILTAVAPADRATFIVEHVPVLLQFAIDLARQLRPLLRGRAHAVLLQGVLDPDTRLPPAHVHHPHAGLVDLLHLVPVWVVIVHLVQTDI